MDRTVVEGTAYLHKILHDRLSVEQYCCCYKRGIECFSYWLCELKELTSKVQVWLMINPKEGASVLFRCAPRDGLPSFVAYFKNTVTQQFRSAENLCPDVWMGGWVAGDILGPPILLEV